MIDPIEKIPREEVEQTLFDRFSKISPYLNEDTQTEAGHMFEALADVTDYDASLAEMQDLG
jgi:hypothetical protein